MIPKDFVNRLPNWPPLNPVEALRENLLVQQEMATWMIDIAEDAGEPLGTMPMTPSGMLRRALRVVELVEMLHPDVREAIEVINIQERQIRRLVEAHA